MDLGFISINWGKKLEEPVLLKQTKEPSASSHFQQIFTFSYDGEKTPGEIGIIKEYDLDYAALRARSWQSYLESEITQDIIKRFATWVIGGGLKLQSEPIELLLENSGIQLDVQSFSKLVEAKFNLLAKSEMIDHAQLDNLNRLAKTAFINAIVGGDVLIIQRIVNGKLTEQLIDGSHVMNPWINSEEVRKDINAGFTVKNGIVTGKRGEHIAYYVRGTDGDFTRIKSKIKIKGTKSFLHQAFLVYGLKYRLNDNRGIPLIAAVLETLKKLDRYKEATVGSAEEAAKIAYFIEHGNNSTGESPLTQNIVAGLGLDNPTLKDDGLQVANKIAATTNKQVFNMIPDSVLKTLNHTAEIHFKEFYTTNINIICAAIEIPPEVALMKYDSNFSASRAALKDWEHTISVNRGDMSFGFYQKIYSFWLSNEVLNNRVKAPGYIESLISGDTELRESYENARFVGAGVPHIDPLKEVNAERAKLGPLGANTPLTTVEAATEAVNGGDFDSNSKQFLREVEPFKIVEKVEVNEENT